MAKPRTVGTSRGFKKQVGKHLDFLLMRKVRAKVKPGGKARWFHISLELIKAALGGAIRAVVSHWLGHP